MVTIGNDTLPGTILTVESSSSTGVNVGAPGDLVIVGEGDLSTGTASADVSEEVRTPQSAKNKFGDTSPLTTAIIDALTEGAYPVYAISPATTSVTGEDLSGLSSNTGTLANAPVTEVASDITFTINSTAHTTVLYYDDDPANVADADIGADEVYLNPVTGKFKIDDSTTVGTAGDDVDYGYLDFSTSLDNIQTDTFGSDKLQEIIDFVVMLSENTAQVADVQTTVGEMETNGAFAIGLVGAGDPYISDTSTYSQSDDDSRMQYYYPTRNDDDESLMGSLGGKRSSIGIDTSPMSKRIESQTDLQFTLTQAQQENLVGERVNPLLDRSSGAKIIDDLTTVDTSTNTEEENFDTGFARLVTDFVAEKVDANSEKYIGELHVQSVRNTLRGVLGSELKQLLDSNAIAAFSLVVDEVDSETASVDVGIKTVSALRNIEATITSGEVTSGAGV